MMYDVIIIGAGVIGSAIARECSRYQWKILVLEKNLEVGEGTTKANSAIVHGGYDALPGTLKARLNVEGARMIRELAPLLDFPYEQIGSLVLAFDEKDEAILRQLLDRGRQNGVEGLSIISREEILALEPNVSGEVRSALRCTVAGIVCPFNLTYALIENALANGVELRTDELVTGLNPEGELFQITTEKNHYHAKVVINAAGIHAADVAALLGETDYRIRPRRGEYRLLDRSEGKMVGHIIFQTPTELGKGVLVTPTVHGNLMIGPDSVEVEDPGQRPATTGEGLGRVDALARKSVPKLRLDRTIRVFSGLRATPDTGDFMIYESKHNPGFLHAGGIESPGLAASPAIGQMVCELAAATGRLPQVKRDQIIERRSGIKAFRQMTPKQREAAIAADPNYGSIICRCETVSEAEILQAIHRPAGAVTMDGVKRRVRPGMGRCQGTFCGPKVIAILARELGISEEEVLKDSRGSRVILGHTKGKE